DRADLARLQQEQVQIRVDHFQDLLQDSTSEASKLEQWALIYYDSAASFLNDVANINLGIALKKPGTSVSFPTLSDLYQTLKGQNPAEGAASTVANSAASLESSLATATALRASLERRRQDWQYQLQLAQQDQLIGRKQVVVAEDDVRVVGQDVAIAAL